jgi:dienelactone hydrolase
MPFRARVASIVLPPVLLGLVACGSPSTQRPAESSPGAMASQAGPRRTSDATAEMVCIALRDRDFAAITAIFDATVRQVLPQEKLVAVWEAQVAELGMLSSWSIAQRAEAEGKDIRLVALKFQKGELMMLLAINPDTQELSGIFFKPARKPAANALPAGDAAAFRVEPVSVGAEPFVLQGKLTLPRGKGAFPAAVLVHGSGPNDMDETVGNNRPFKDLAEGLASHGIAVLRYDKRTFQYRDRVSRDLSIDDEVVVDAVAAIRLLKARAEIDRERVFVLGHSLGALLAPEIAVRSGPVAGAVLLAPPGRPPWHAIVEQMKYAGAPPERIAEIQRSFDKMQAGGFREGSVLSVPASYWQDWASRDGIGFAKKLHKPVLILRGERDYQITEEDIAAWKKGLAGVERVDFATIPGDNHLFISGSGKPGPAEYDTPGHVDERVIERIAAFVQRPSSTSSASSYLPSGGMR